MEKSNKDLYYILTEKISRDKIKHPVLWTNGEVLLSNDCAAANAVADILDACGYYSSTGYYDPIEDANSGCTDECTGFWYIDV